VTPASTDDRFVGIPARNRGHSRTSPIVGRERLWQLEPGQIEEPRRTLEVIGRQWDVALEKLKALVEPL
jgi:hypothetical protein